MSALRATGSPTQAAAARGRRADPHGSSPRHPSEPMIDLAGNDYLGLARHPRVVDGRGRGRRGVRRRGRRLAAGHRDPDAARASSSSALAAFTGFPTALVFSTGYHANLSAVSALADADTLVVSDAHVHASMIDACRLARGRRCRWSRTTTSPPSTRRWPAAPRPRALVLVETIYSVLGDAAPVAELAEVCAARTTRCWSPTRRTRSASPAPAAAACCTRPASPAARRRRDRSR